MFVYLQFVCTRLGTALVSCFRFSLAAGLVFNKVANIFEVIFISDNAKILLFIVYYNFYC